jgi:transcriptional regulator with XRE-family HTH domain
MKTRLKELRVEKGYTQQEVANAIMCAVSTYAHYEKDERRIDPDTLINLSKFFKVSIDYILYNEVVGEING